MMLYFKCILELHGKNCDNCDSCLFTVEHLANCHKRQNYYIYVEGFEHFNLRTVFFVTLNSVYCVNVENKRKNVT